MIRTTNLNQSTYLKKQMVNEKEIRTEKIVSIQLPNFSIVTLIKLKSIKDNLKKKKKNVTLFLQPKIVYL